LIVAFRPTVVFREDANCSVGARMNRGQFERLLVRRLDRVRVGSAQRAKRLIGGAWRAIIDDMYERNAERLSANEFASVVTECADAIVHLMKSIKY
jgi:hypothetical protein